MTPERWQQINQLFDEVLEQPAAERAAFLTRACAGDEELRRRVEAMLAADAQAELLLDHPAQAAAAELLSAEISDTQASEILSGHSIGSYRLLREVGRGGMGKVYLAHDERLDRRVALKLLPARLTDDADRVARFQREARAASALNHPNILTIYDFGQENSRHYIATEFVAGQTLRAVIGNPDFKLTQALDVAIQVASALAAAHQAGIIHRDIKPENIMLRPDGYVKVLDFGLAKLTEARSSADEAETLASADSGFQTQKGVVLGTVSYMSPEQAGGQKVDARTDIFSLGVVLYEIITGHRPFEGATRNHVLVAILDHEPPPLAEHGSAAPAALQRIIARALRKERADRYQTMRELLDDLQEVRDEITFRARQERHSGSIGEAPHAAAAGAVQSQAGRRRSGALWWAAILLVAASVLAVGVYEYSSARRARSAPPSVKLNRLTANGKIGGAAITRDGKYIAYAAGPPRQHSLWVMQTTTASHSQLIPPAAEVLYWGMTFSNAGDYIYYVRNAGSGQLELYRVPTLGGTPKRLLVNIDSAVTFSPDGQQLAFGRDIGGETHLVVANADGTSERTLATRRRPDYFDFQGIVKISWSPDGEKIACPAGNTEFPLANRSELVEVRVKDGAEKPITRQRWADLRQIAWLGDGSGLVFVAKDKWTSPAQLWHLSYPAGEVRKLTNDFSHYIDLSVALETNVIVTVQNDRFSNVWVAPGGDAARARQITDSRDDGVSGISWTPDGRIVYCSNVGGNPDIWIMDADGGNRRRLTDSPAWDVRPSVSGDGRYVIFESRSADKLGIWRMDIDGGNLVQLTGGKGEIEPQCSPDGRWVYYRSAWGALWKVPLDGGDPVLVLDKGIGGPIISPDQKLLAYRHLDLQMNPPYGLAVAPLEGGQPIKQFAINHESRAIHWTPDGRALTYVDDRQLNVWAQPLDGSKPVQLTNFKSDQTFYFDWSHDGKQLALARGTITSDVVLISDFK
jgi:Tol biopolymer transport system component